MPEVPTREEVLVDHRLVLVVDDGARHPPPFPAGLHGAVAEIDVLHIELVPRVPASDLLEHRATHEQKRSEHRVDLKRLGSRRVEQVVTALPSRSEEHTSELQSHHDL